MIGAFAGSIPVLGVCLGHQSIVQHFGGEIIGAAALMHGKTSLVQHDGATLYRNLPNPFEVGRYHSLAANRERMPAELLVTARTTDGEIMGVRHRELNVEGVQFHPESVLTPEGPRLLAIFLYPCAHIRSNCSSACFAARIWTSRRRATCCVSWRAVTSPLPWPERCS
jgi:anthranilate synthase/aminodeoxychorismate synthase-like glutamine amidotransferase